MPSSQDHIKVAWTRVFDKLMMLRGAQPEENAPSEGLQGPYNFSISAPTVIGFGPMTSAL